MKYSLTNLIDKIGKHDTSMYEKYIPLFISEARKGLNWDEWNPDVFEQYFEKAANAVAYLGQGVMRPAQKETVKRRWTELAPHLKAIAESQDVPLWNEYKVIREIVKSCTGANMQVATNRMLAGLQPKLLSTEVDLVKINELFDYLQDYTDAPIPQYNKDCWEEAGYALTKLLHAAAPDRTPADIEYLPWKLLEFFREKSAELPSYWLTSWNEKDFRLHDYLKKYDQIDWNNKNNNRFKVGDIVFLYSSHPERRIRYKMKVLMAEVPVDERIDDSEYAVTPTEPSEIPPVRLKFIDSVDTQLLDYNALKENGVKGFIRSPRRLSGDILSYINAVWFGLNLKQDYGELEKPDEIYEGAKKTVVVNRYERNSEARIQCIKKHGCRCSVCGMDFEKTYGELGKGFIHVHHIVPLSEIGKEYRLNPIEDLVPVCPNCHQMLHRGIDGKVLTTEQLKEIIRKAKG